MNDKEIYIAIVVDKGDWGQQLLRYAFEYPITEYFGEAEEQTKMKQYFKANHYTHDEPLQIEKADIMDFMPYTNSVQLTQSQKDKS